MLPTARGSINEDLRGCDDVEDDDDEEEVKAVVEEKQGEVAAPPRSLLYRSFVLKYGDDVLLSFEALPSEPTEKLLDRGSYLCMALYAFGRGVTLPEIKDVIEEYLNIEVRGG